MPNSMTRARGRRRADVAAIICAIVAALSLTTAERTRAIAASPGDAEASLAKAEDQLFAADVRRDPVAIARGFADEAIFVHANGTVQTKAEYLQATTQGNVSIKSIDTVDRVVRVFGNVGVVRGTKNLVVGNMHLSGSYLTVYVMRDGRWQMLDEQSAPAPRPPESK